MHRFVEGATVRLKADGTVMRVKLARVNVLAAGGFVVLCEWSGDGGGIKSAIYHADELEFLAPAERK